MLIVRFNEFWQMNTTEASTRLWNITGPPEIFLMCLLSQFLPPASRSSCSSDLLSPYMNLICCRYHINRIVQYIFLVRLLRLCLMKNSVFFFSFCHMNMSKFIKCMDTWEISSLGLLRIKLP